MTDHLDQRQAVIRAARQWRGTPYKHMGRQKGRRGGVDCIQLLIMAYVEAGIVPPIKLEYYPKEWHLHHNAERYLLGLARHCREVSSPQEGDIALWRFGRTFSHGAIVTGWPVIVHSWINQGCVEEDVSKAPWLSHMGSLPRPVKFFSPLVWGA